jgi:hypothetical protein
MYTYIEITGGHKDKDKERWAPSSKEAKMVHVNSCCCYTCINMPSPKVGAQVKGEIINLPYIGITCKEA